MRCRKVQRRLEADGASPSPEDLEHLAQCPECSAHRALTSELETVFDASAAPEPLAPALRVQVESQARQALAGAQLPRIFRRDVVLALCLAALAFPLALAQGWLWLSGLFLVLEAWLPVPLLAGASVIYVVSVGLSLGFLYASLPFAVAYSRRIQAEAS
jgi:hypothetical protein